jgi:hypothetical protein
VLEIDLAELEIKNPVEVTWRGSNGIPTVSQVFLMEPEALFRDLAKSVGEMWSKIPEKIRFLKVCLSFPKKKILFLDRRWTHSIHDGIFAKSSRFFQNKDLCRRN